MLFAVCSIQSKETYYYKQTKVIRNGQQDTKTVGGQFITFIENACYESTNEGIGVGHGYLTYKKDLSSLTKIYIGSSYWGDNTEFRFSQDLSKLNVCLEDGTVYVYTRTTPPTSQTTCSLIRPKGSSGGGGTPIVTQPSYNGGYAGGNINSTTNNYNGQSTRQTTPSKRWKNVTRTYDCDRCYRSGKCQTCNGKGYTYGIGNSMVDCRNCDGYKTGRCSKCHGSGTITKIEQVYE